MERNVFITKAGVNYGAGLDLETGGFWTSDTLTAGGIAIFNSDQSVVDGTATVSASDLTGSSIYIGAMGVNGFKSSIEIPRSNFSYTKRDYVAPVAAIKCLGNNETGDDGSLNLPSSISVGDTVGVTIRDRSKGHEDTSAIIDYSFAVTTGDLITGTGVSNIITKLVALVNGNSNSVVTAAVLSDGSDADGIKFTAKTAGMDFDVIRMDGVLKDADVLEYKEINHTYLESLTNTVRANNPGTGTSTQATAAEYDSNIRMGDTHSQVLGNKLWTAGTNVVAGATYTVYSIYSTPLTESPTNREVNYKQLVQIFVPSGEEGADKAITVLNDIFALVNP